MAVPKAQTLQQRFGFMDDDLKTPKHDEMMLWLDKNAINIVKQLFYIQNWDQSDIEDQKKRMIEAVKIAKEKYQSKSQRLREGIERNGLGSNKEYWQNRIKEDRVELEKVLDYWASLDNWNIPSVPPKPNITGEVKWEEVVKRDGYKSEYIIGFIDLTVYYKDRYLSTNVTGGYGYGGLEFTEYEFPEWRIGQDSKAAHFEVKSSIPSLGELIRQINTYREYVKSPFVVVSPDDRFIEPLKSQGIHFFKYPSGNGK